jgi:hypothetical protein
MYIGVANGLFSVLSPLNIVMNQKIE